MSKVNPYLQIKNLSITLGEFQLHDINLSIAPKEYFVLLGPTGAGKTILLESLVGLQRNHSGKIFINQQDLTQTPPEKRKIGFVYQDYALFPHLNVQENIAFGKKAQHRTRTQRLLPFFNNRPIPSKEFPNLQEEIEKISQLLKIEELLHRKPTTLSGGEQQRVALARALITQPRLLLLDEPLGALDPETREKLQQEMQRIHREVGTTTIHVTHDFEEAITLGDRIGIIHRGRIVQVDTPETIFRRPNSHFVAKFVGTQNIFPIQNIQKHVNGFKSINPKTLQILTNQNTVPRPSHFTIRPEDINITKHKPVSPNDNHLSGKVGKILNKGALIFLTILVPTQQNGKPHAFIAALTHRTYHESSIKIDDTVHLTFPASTVHIFEDSPLPS